MFAPFVNPYEPGMSKEERHATWSKWTSKRKLLFFLARKFPRSLRYFYRRSFLSGSHDQIDKRLSFSAGKKVSQIFQSFINLFLGYNTYSEIHAYSLPDNEFVTINQKYIVS